MGGEPRRARQTRRARPGSREADQPGSSSDVGTPPPAASGRSVERYRPVIEGYLSDMCGREAAARLTKHVVADLAYAPGPVMLVDTDPVAAVRGTARLAAVGWLQREARRIPRRLTGRRCQIVPGLLLERSEGRIAAEDLERLSKHVDSCPRCSALAVRYVAAERALVAELIAKPRVIGPSRPTAGEAAREAGRASVVTPEGTVARRAPSDATRGELVGGPSDAAGTASTPRTRLPPSRRSAPASGVGRPDAARNLTSGRPARRPTPPAPQARGRPR